jgi:pimeloyl-ACP methyl ester carboxylesterase
MANMLILATALGGLLHIVQGLPTPHMQQNSSLVWGNCTYFEYATEYYGKVGAPHECAILQVPLDYTNPSSTETMSLDLIRVKSSAKKVLGSLIVNPGGPGGSGLKYVAHSWASLLMQSGGQYDIIGFDPRGSGRALPELYCGQEKDQWPSQKRHEQHPRSDNLTDVTLQVAEDIWPQLTANAAACKISYARTGTFYGTVSVVRDMVRILDAIGGDGLLRYHGM